MRPRRITIVGLGLIGGSLAAASRRAFPRARIVGVTRSQEALAQAKKRKWIHEGSTDLKSAFSSVGAPLVGARIRRKGQAQGLPLHLVVLCTPVDTLRGLLKSLDRLARPGTLVTDTGSVKGFLVRWADRRRWRRVHFVGAHPMAGSHQQGIQAAQPRLFDRALCFVTPGRFTSKQALHRVTDFWKKISGRVCVISPEKHDRLTAQVSHLPHLTAALLVNVASSEALGFAASGFLDTTRIAQGDPGLWAPIFLENRKELHRFLRNFEVALARLDRVLKTKDPKRLKQTLARAQSRRAALE